MTKHEQIKEHLRSIRYFCSPGIVWDLSKITSKLEKELDAIRALLQSRPETLASSVIRLTDECNTLEKKNYELNLKLTQYRAGWCPYDCATVEELAKLRAEIERLKQEIAKLKRHYETAKVLLDNKNQYINSLEKDLDAVTQGNVELMEEILKQNKYIEILKKDRRAMLEQGYSIPSKLLEENRKLNREYALQKKYVEILEREARNYSRRLTWWSKLQAKK